MLMLPNFILAACWGLLSVVTISGFGTHQRGLLPQDSLLACWLTSLCVLLWLLDPSSDRGLLILVAAAPTGCLFGATLGSSLHLLRWDWLLDWLVRSAVTAFPGLLLLVYDLEWSFNHFFLSFV